MTAPPMAYYGGKTRLAARIAELLPAHDHYIEPYAGSLAVLLAKKPSHMETVNDLDGLLMRFWRALRDKPRELARACALTPHSRGELTAARAVNLHQLADAELDEIGDVEVARLVWVMISQARGGTMRSTGWRAYIDPGGTKTSMPGYLDAYVDRMAECAQRLHNVSLECRPALEIIAKYGQVARCCLYVDPPYLGTTRSHGGNGYRLEMRGQDEHVELLDALQECRASVVLSGYHSDLYADALADWARIDIPTITGQATTSAARTEVIWCNRPLLTQSAFDFDSLT